MLAAWAQKVAVVSRANAVVQRTFAAGARRTNRELLESESLIEDRWVIGISWVIQVFAVRRATLPDVYEKSKNFA